MKIIPLAQQPTYINRCVQCRYGFTIKFNAFECVSCSISNCARCFYGSSASADYTMDYNFPPASDPTNTIYTLMCYQCRSGYVLNQARTSCSIVLPAVSSAAPNCEVWKVNSMGTTVCAKCKNGKSLDSLGNCNDDCYAILNDFLCKSCYSYTDGP